MLWAACAGSHVISAGDIVDRDRCAHGFIKARLLAAVFAMIADARCRRKSNYFRVIFIIY